MQAELINHIRHSIENAGGCISFATFMQLALYAPGLGYYSAGTHKFGKGGDFVTAPEISPLFAVSIAHQFQQILTELGSGDILELGAGSGVFAKDVLLELEKLNCLPNHYFILEISADLREKQAILLATHCPHLLNRITWLDYLPADFTGVIFANEVMDAMPVNCFRLENNVVLERCVSWQDDHFAWCLQPATPELENRVKMILAEQPLQNGFESETNLMLPAWLNSLADCLTKGIILLADYGYGRREYYRPERSSGTLMCFLQQQKNDNPLINVGLQDITAHVDFTLVAESAINAGLNLIGYTTQAAFLLALGITDRVPHGLSAADHYRVSQEIKRLMLPSQMGEMVKAMALGKNMDLNLLGFTLQDRRHDL